MVATKAKGSGSSKYRGVAQTKVKSKPWRAQIWANGKNHFVGNFKTQKEAALAYDEKAVEHHGLTWCKENEWLNFPENWENVKKIAGKKKVAEVVEPGNRAQMNFEGKRMTAITKPVVRKLKLDELYVPMELQRKLKVAVVQQIVGAFDDRKFGTIVATDNGKGGAYRIVDGQHRFEAAHQLGLGTVPVAIYPVKSKKDEADLLLGYNKTRAVPNATDTFRFECQKGSKDHVACQKAIEASGFSTVVGGSGVLIQAVGACMNVHMDTNVDLADVLFFIDSAWPEEKDGVQSLVISGLAKFMSSEGYIEYGDEDHLVKSLAKRTPGYLMTAARAQHGKTRCGLHVAFAHQVASLYNKGIRTRKGKINLD